MSTSVNGILGASCGFCDEDEEDEDGPPTIRVDQQEWFDVSQNQLMCFRDTEVRGVCEEYRI